MTSEPVFDTIIVGAGSAGAVLAARLSEDPARSVLLIEAGPDYASLDETPEEVRRALPRDVTLATKLLGAESPHDWAYTARATDKLDGIPIPRGRVVGGSSAVNSSIFLRGVPEDYDLWASAGNDEWSYSKLLPYLRQVEADSDFDDEYHGRSGRTPVTRFGEGTWAVEQDAFYRACIAAGYRDSPDHNGPASTGVGPLPLNVSDGVRWSTALAYLNDCRDRPNLTIRAESHVYRVLIDGRTATGVEVEGDAGPSKVSAGEVILSAGAIASPQILMLSGVGPAAGMESAGVAAVHHLPGVGRNLWDHPQVHATFRTTGKQAGNEDALRLQVGLRYTASGSALRNDMFLIPALFTSHATGGGPAALRLVLCLYFAQAVGELALVSADPHDQPFLDFNYFADPSDRKRMRDGLRICAEIGAREEFSGLIDHRTAPDDSQLNSTAALDDWMSRNVTTSHHAAGTCKMGPSSDDMAVVDQYGRLHGLDGLRVVDASIMPSAVRANTHLTSVVIGERIADFIHAGS